MDLNLRIFSDFGSIYNTSIGVDVGYLFAELVVHRFGSFSLRTIVSPGANSVTVPVLSVVVVVV